jgi:hypothetical protein
VVVVPAVSINLTDSEVVLEHAETFNAFRALCNCELMTHLIASSVAFATESLSLTDEVDGKTSFTVHKTAYPTNLDQPFLLIFRS